MGDLVFHNGRFVHQGILKEGSLIIRENKIFRFGKDPVIQTHSSDSRIDIELNGALVLPALVDEYAVIDEFSRNEKNLLRMIKQFYQGGISRVSLHHISHIFPRKWCDLALKLSKYAPTFSLYDPANLVARTNCDRFSSIGYRKLSFPGSGQSEWYLSKRVLSLLLPSIHPVALLEDYYHEYDHLPDQSYLLGGVKEGKNTIPLLPELLLRKNPVIKKSIPPVSPQYLSYYQGSNLRFGTLNTCEFTFENNFPWAELAYPLVLEWLSMDVTHLGALEIGQQDLSIIMPRASLPTESQEKCRDLGIEIPTNNVLYTLVNGEIVYSTP